jgi:hypothetical protein
VNGQDHNYYQQFCLIAKTAELISMKHGTHVQCLSGIIRAVPDLIFSNPAGAGVGRI